MSGKLIAPPALCLFFSLISIVCVAQPGAAVDGLSCAPCSVGMYSGTTSAPFCNPCLGGTYTGVLQGASTCLLCEAGSSSGASQSACNNCTFAALSVCVIEVCLRTIAFSFVQVPWVSTSALRDNRRGKFNLFPGEADHY